VPLTGKNLVLLPLAAATGRLSTILAYLRGESVSVTKRSVQNCCAAIGKPNVFTAVGLWGYWTSRRVVAIGCLVSMKPRTAFETFLRTHYAAPQAKRRLCRYALYRDECTKQHLSPVSQATFYRDVSSLRHPR